MSATKIARLVGSSTATVLDALREHGFEIRHGKPRQFPLLDDVDYLTDRYWTRRWSLADIAADLGCAESQVLYALRKHGIEVRRPGQRRKGHTRTPNVPKLADPDWLRVRYIEWNRTTTQIAAELGCSSRAVSKALAKHGIPARRPGPRNRTTTT